jgi:hypothetical protein
LWAKDSAAITDKVPHFSITYLDPSWAEKSKELILADTLNWLENRGSDKREYKNALAFVVPNKAQMDKARKGARTALAISSLIEQKTKYKFSTEDLELRMQPVKLVQLFAVFMTISCYRYPTPTVKSQSV